MYGYNAGQPLDSAVIIATVTHKPDALQELVKAGAELNLQNEVS